MTNIPDLTQDPAFLEGMNLYKGLSQQGAPTEEEIVENVVPAPEEDNYETLLQQVVREGENHDSEMFKQLAGRYAGNTRSPETFAADAEVLRDAYKLVYDSPTEGDAGGTIPSVLEKYKTPESREGFKRAMSYIGERQSKGLDKDFQETLADRGYGRDVVDKFSRGLNDVVLTPIRLLAENPLDTLLPGIGKRSDEMKRAEKYLGVSKAVEALDKVKESIDRPTKAARDYLGFWDALDGAQSAAQSKYMQNEYGPIIGRVLNGPAAAAEMVPALVGAVALGLATKGQSAKPYAGSILKKAGQFIMANGIKSPGTWYWTAQIAPNVIQAMEDNGVDHETARAIGLPTAFLSAMGENAVTGRVFAPVAGLLTKGLVKKLSGDLIAKEGLKKGGSAVLSYLGNYGLDVIQEGMQGITEQGGEELANLVSGVKPFSVENIMKSGWEQGIEALFVSPWLSMPGGTINAVNNYRAKRNLEGATPEALYNYLASQDGQELIASAEDNKAFIDSVVKYNTRPDVQELFGVLKEKDIKEVQDVLLAAGKHYFPTSAVYADVYNEMTMRKLDASLQAVAEAYGPEKAKALAETLKDYSDVRGQPDSDAPGTIRRNQVLDAFLDLDTEALANIPEVLKAQTGIPQLFSAVYDAGGPLLAEHRAAVKAVRAKYGDNAAEAVATSMAAARLTPEDALRLPEKQIREIEQEIFPPAGTKAGPTAVPVDPRSFIVDSEPDENGIVIPRLDGEALLKELQNRRPQVALPSRIMQSLARAQSRTLLIPKEAETTVRVREKQEETKDLELDAADRSAEARLGGAIEAAAVEESTNRRQETFEARDRKFKQAKARDTIKAEKEVKAQRLEEAKERSIENAEQAKADEGKRDRFLAENREAAGLPAPGTEVKWTEAEGTAKLKGAEKLAQKARMALWDEKVSVVVDDDGSVYLVPKGKQNVRIRVKVGTPDQAGVTAEWSKTTNTVWISETAGDKAGAKITHEILHAMKDLGFINRQEWSRLKTASGKLLTTKQKQDLRDRYGIKEDEKSDRYDHESVAYMLENLESLVPGVKNRKSAQEALSWRNKVRSWLQSVADTMLDVKTPLTENDRQFLREIAAGSAFGNQPQRPKTDEQKTEVYEGFTITPPSRFSIEVYHGTPHKVDEFKTEKIGTGEGALAYGWGLYFAEAKSIAEWYRGVLSERKYDYRTVEKLKYDLKNEKERTLRYLYSYDKERPITINGVDAKDNDSGSVEHQVLAIMDEWDSKNPISLNDMLKAAKDRAFQTWSKDNKDGIRLDPYEEQLKVARQFGIDGDGAVSLLRSLGSYKESQANVDSLENELSKVSGNLYQVEIDADEAMLMYDEPIGDKYQAVKDDISGKWLDNTLGQLNAEWNELKGRELYHLVRKALDDDAIVSSAADEALAQGNDKKAASLYLLSKGIPGIKYLDGSSRRAGEGNYNYAVFDEKLIKIIKENGVPKQSASRQSREETPSVFTPKQSTAKTLEDTAFFDNDGRRIAFATPARMHDSTAAQVGKTVNEVLDAGVIRHRLDPESPIGTLQMTREPTMAQYDAIGQIGVKIVTTDLADGDKEKFSHNVATNKVSNVIKTYYKDGYDKAKEMLDRQGFPRYSRSERSKSFKEVLAGFKEKQLKTLKAAAAKQKVPAQRVDNIRGIFHAAATIASSVRNEIRDEQRTDRKQATAERALTRAAKRVVSGFFEQPDGQPKLKNSDKLSILYYKVEELEAIADEMKGMDDEAKAEFLSKKLPGFATDEKTDKILKRPEAVLVFEALKNEVESRIYSAIEQKLTDLYGRDGNGGALASLARPAGPQVAKEIEELRRTVRGLLKPVLEARDLRRQLVDMRKKLRELQETDGADSPAVEAEEARLEADPDFTKTRDRLSELRKLVEAQRGDYDLYREVVKRGMEIEEGVAQIQEETEKKNLDEDKETAAKSLEEITGTSILPDLPSDTGLDNTDPGYLRSIHRSGDSTEHTMAELGMESVRKIMVDSHQAQNDYMAKLQNAYEVLITDELKIDKKTLKSMRRTLTTGVTYNGKPVRVTAFQRIALRAYARDTDAWGKILLNGFKPSHEASKDYTKDNREVNEAAGRLTGGESSALPGELAQAIIDAEIPAEQRRIEERIADFFLTEANAFANNEGNAASQKVSGINKFADEMIMSLAGSVHRPAADPDVDTLLQKPGGRRPSGVKNTGIVKERVFHREPIIISDASEIYERWSRKVATYAAWARSYQTVTRVLTDTKVKDSLVRKLGKPGYDKMLKFIDILTYQERIVAAGHWSRAMNTISGLITGRALAASASAIGQNRVGGKSAYYFQLRADGNSKIAAKYLATSMKGADKNAVKGLNPLTLAEVDAKELDELESFSGYLRLRWDRRQFSRLLFGVTHTIETPTPRKFGNLSDAYDKAIDYLGDAAFRGLVIAEQSNAIELYRILKEEGYTPEKAARYLETLTKETQNPSDIIDASNFYLMLQQNPGARLFFPFMGQATTTQLNLRRNTLKAVRKSGIPASETQTLLSRVIAARSTEEGRRIFDNAVTGWLSQATVGIVAGILSALARGAFDDKTKRVNRLMRKQRKLFAWTSAASSLADQTVPGSGQFIETIGEFFGVGKASVAELAEPGVASSFLYNLVGAPGGVAMKILRGKKVSNREYYDAVSKPLGVLLPIRGYLTVLQGMFGAGAEGYEELKELSESLDKEEE